LVICSYRFVNDTYDCIPVPTPELVSRQDSEQFTPKSVEENLSKVNLSAHISPLFILSEEDKVFNSVLKLVFQALRAQNTKI
jgi:hypothetical protein